MNEEWYELMHQNWSRLIFLSEVTCRAQGMSPQDWNMKETSVETLARAYRIAPPCSALDDPLFQVGYTFPVGILHPPLHTTPFYKYYHWRPHWGESTQRRATLQEEVLAFHAARRRRRLTRMVLLHHLPLPTDLAWIIDAYAGYA